METELYYEIEYIKTELEKAGFKRITVRHEGCIEVIVSNEDIPQFLKLTQLYIVEPYRYGKNETPYYVSM
jgi:hypothetical protein